MLSSISGVGLGGVLFRVALVDEPEKFLFQPDHPAANGQCGYNQVDDDKADEGKSVNEKVDKIEFRHDGSRITVDVQKPLHRVNGQGLRFFQVSDAKCPSMRAAIRSAIARSLNAARCSADGSWMVTLVFE